MNEDRITLGPVSRDILSHDRPYCPPVLGYIDEFRIRKEWPPLSTDLWAEKMRRDYEKASYFRTLLPPEPAATTWQVLKWWGAEIVWRIRDAFLVLAGRAHICIEDDEEGRE